MSTRLALQRGYVLHARPYRETSLLLDCLTIEGGRVSMVAKGARRGKGQQRRFLQPFAPLLLSYFGQSELHTLTAVEEAGGSRRLLGERLACGLYLNELLVYLLPREEPVAELFAFYNRALDELAGDEPLSPLLRRFELQLLESMGVAPDWAKQCDSGELVVADREYTLSADGPLLATGIQKGAVALIQGSTLLALAAGEPDAAGALVQSKQVLRYFIHLHLGGRQLKSRELLRGPILTAARRSE